MGRGGGACLHKGGAQHARNRRTFLSNISREWGGGERGKEITMKENERENSGKGEGKQRKVERKKERKKKEKNERKKVRKKKRKKERKKKK